MSLCFYEARYFKEKLLESERLLSVGLVLISMRVSVVSVGKSQTGKSDLQKQKSVLGVS